jgi:hypothetical protein
MAHRDPPGTEAEFEEINSVGARAVRFIKIAVFLGMLNILTQAAVLAFSLTSLASGVAELPSVVAVIGEVGGVAAVAVAALASAIGVVYTYDAHRKVWQLARAHVGNRPATRRPRRRRGSLGS